MNGGFHGVLVIVLVAILSIIWISIIFGFPLAFSERNYRIEASISIDEGEGVRALTLRLQTKGSINLILHRRQRPLVHRLLRP